MSTGQLYAKKLFVSGFVHCWYFSKTFSVNINTSFRLKGLYLCSLKTLDFIFKEDHATHDENDTV